jgi:hypothetical protein
MVTQPRKVCKYPAELKVNCTTYELDCLRVRVRVGGSKESLTRVIALRLQEWKSQYIWSIYFD